MERNKSLEERVALLERELTKKPRLTSFFNNNYKEPDTSKNEIDILKNRVKLLENEVKKLKGILNEQS